MIACDQILSVVTCVRWHLNLNTQLTVRIVAVNLAESMVSFEAMNITLSRNARKQVTHIPRIAPDMHACKCKPENIHILKYVWTGACVSSYMYIRGHSYLSGDTHGHVEVWPRWIWPRHISPSFGMHWWKPLHLQSFVHYHFIQKSFTKHNLKVVLQYIFLKTSNCDIQIWDQIF